MKRWISGSPKRRGNLLFREMRHSSFQSPQQRVDVNNWPNCSQYSNRQSCWHRIRCGIGKGRRVPAYVLLIKSDCLHFYPETPLIARWSKSDLILTEVSFSVEILQFWGKTFAQEIAGSKLVLRVECCFPALGVSGILAFAESLKLNWNSFKLAIELTGAWYFRLTSGVSCTEPGNVNWLFLVNETNERGINSLSNTGRFRWLGSAVLWQ